MCPILELAARENTRALENRWNAVRLDRSRAMMVYKLSQEAVDMLLQTPHEVLVEKTKEANQAIFVDNQIEDLLKPFKTQLTDFRKRVDDVYDKESKDRVSLHTEILNLQKLNTQISEDALNLTNALKGDSKTQGNWGEMVLERILEESGLQEGREYEREVSITQEDGKRKRPDVIVRLPEQKDVVIDSKVSLTAYENFCSAENKEKSQRRNHF